MNLSESTYRNLRGKTYQYHHSVSLPPGEYLLKLILMDGNSNAVGYLEEPLKLPSISNEDFISDIVIAESVKTVEQKEEKIDTSELIALKSLQKIKVPEKINLTMNRAPFVFHNLMVVPKIKNFIKRDKELIFFYQIYPISSDSKIRVEHVIEKNGRRFAMAGEPQLITTNNLEPINNGAKVPLSSFEKGDYVLKVIAFDSASGKKIEKSISFNVI